MKYRSLENDGYCMCVYAKCTFYYKRIVLSLSMNWIYNFIQKIKTQNPKCFLQIVAYVFFSTDFPYYYLIFMYENNKRRRKESMDMHIKCTAPWSMGLKHITNDNSFDSFIAWNVHVSSGRHTHYVLPTSFRICSGSDDR